MSCRFLSLHTLVAPYLSWAAYLRLSYTYTYRKYTQLQATNLYVYNDIYGDITYGVKITGIIYFIFELYFRVLFVSSFSPLLFLYLIWSVIGLLSISKDQFLCLKEASDPLPKRANISLHPTEVFGHTGHLFTWTWSSPFCWHKFCFW